MAGSSVSVTVTHTVQLGGASYPSPLMIAGSGVVAPSAYGAVGVVAVVSDARLVNQGRISGALGNAYGSAPGIGVDLRSGGDRLTNSGTITGGSGNNFTYPHYPGADGAIGVAITSGAISNGGEIIGGVGGYAYGARPGNGGLGVSLDASSLTNTGIITGGYGNYGGAGGMGVDLTSSGSVVRNSGEITGGVGGGFTEGGGYYGGVGVGMTAGDTLINTGEITGGQGGYGFGFDSFSGDGGVGLVVGAGDAVNRGNITGGEGGRYAGSGGAGVTIDGGTLTNFGVISGGDPGQVNPFGVVQADAVQFGTLASTLIVQAGAVFEGLVVANAAVDDGLRLAGDGGTLSGLGTSFTGFTDIVENAGATWTLASTNTLDAGAGLRDLGALTVSGTLGGAGGVLIGGSATLQVLGSLDATIVHFAAGGGAVLDIGADASVGSTLTGFFTGDTIDVAKAATTLSYLGGTLTLLDGSTPVQSLLFKGPYTTANFHLAEAGGESRITYVPSAGAPLADFAPALGVASAAEKASPAFATVSHAEDGLAGALLTIGHLHAG